jgi:hypothetical protein
VAARPGDVVLRARDVVIVLAVAAVVLAAGAVCAWWGPDVAALVGVLEGSGPDPRGG